MPAGKRLHSPVERLRGSVELLHGCGLPWQGAPTVEMAAPGAFAACGKRPRAGEGERQANNAVESNAQVE
jgi:hypothetical protein